MGQLPGKDAAIKKNSVAVALMTEWTLDVDLDQEEITDFGDDWAAIAANIAKWAITMVGFFEPN